MLNGSTSTWYSTLDGGRATDSTSRNTSCNTRGLADCNWKW
jgi:hypothetical protein